jgi:hypothetical protein
MKMTNQLIALLLALFSVQANANWQCYAVDQGNHFWKSSGMTQERASQVALSFCSAYSPNGKSCQVSKCMEEGV